MILEDDDGCLSGCLTFIGIGFGGWLLASLVIEFISFVRRPVVGIPLGIVAAVIAWCATTAYRNKMKAFRFIIQKYGTASQKERLAAGYIDIKREGKEVLIPIAFKALLEAGFERSKEETNWSFLDKTKATERDYQMLRRARAVYPKLGFELVRLGQSEPVTGVRASGTFTLIESGQKCDLSINFTSNQK